MKELVMPIKYVDVPQLAEDELRDDLMVLIKRFQWEDWTELRFLERESASYRQAVSKLAERLVAANASAERVDVADALASEQAEDSDGEAGLLDRMAKAEEVMPEWVGTIERIGREIEDIGRLMQEATTDMGRSDTQGKGLAGRLVTLRRVANELETPAERIRDFGREFTSQLNDVDQGIRSIIEVAGSQAETEAVPQSEVCDFFSVVRGMVDSAESGLGSLQGMIDAMAPIEKMSRDLRRPLKRMRESLTLMMEGREIMRGWTELIGASPIQCPDSSLPLGDAGEEG